MTRPARRVARRSGRRRAHVVTTWLRRCWRKVGNRRRACGTTGPAGSRGGPKIVTRNDPDLAAAAAREGDAVRRRLHHDRAAPIVRPPRIPIHVIIIRLSLSLSRQLRVASRGATTPKPLHLTTPLWFACAAGAMLPQWLRRARRVPRFKPRRSVRRVVVALWAAGGCVPLGSSLRGARAGRIRRESRARGRGFGRRSRVDG